MKKPNVLDHWDLVTWDVNEMSGDEINNQPLTRENFNDLISEHNKLVDVVILLAEKQGIEFDEEN